MRTKIIFPLSLILSSVFFLPGLQAQIFLGEVKIIAGNYAPAGWALCDGSLLPTSSHKKLYEVIGTTYGGDATNFALPDFRGRIPIGMTGDNYSEYRGRRGTKIEHPEGKTGTETVTITASHLPLYRLEVPAYDLSPEETDATHHFEHGNKSFLSVGNEPNNTIKARAGSTTGEAQPFSIMQPALTLNYIIWIDEEY